MEAFKLNNSLSNIMAYINLIIDSHVAIVSIVAAYRTHLHDAAHRGDADKVKELIINGANVNARDEFKNTPLHFAVGKDHETIVRLLLENGAEVNSANEDFWTPLHLAATENRPRIAEILLLNDAQINSADDKGRTPLDLAQYQHSQEVINILLQHGGFATNTMPPNPCFIASAAYGSPLAPEVQFLRDVRDERLRSTKYGNKFVNAYEWAYYQFSPQVAEFMQKDERIKNIIRYTVVTPLVYCLKFIVKWVYFLERI